MQLARPFVNISWDTSLTAVGGTMPSLTALEISSSGLALAPPEECQDSSCVKVTSGGWMKLPAYAWGQHEAISFSLWFKPQDGSYFNARLFDIGTANDYINLVCLGRWSGGSQIVVTVRNTDVDPSWQLCTSSDNAWVVDKWTHVVFVFQSAPSRRATVTLYVNGKLDKKCSSVYLTNTVNPSNVIGAANYPADNPLIAYLDTFFIFTAALGAREAQALYQVRDCITQNSFFLVYSLHHSFLCTDCSGFPWDGRCTATTLHF
jgi:hypothetical protein